MSTDAEPRWRRLEPDARREQIFTCARRLFRERPYSAVSTADIAQAAGVARGLVNHYFGTKRNLYLQVIKRMMFIPEEWAETLPDGPVEVRVQIGLTQFLDRISRHSKAWLSMSGAAGVGHDPDVEEILAEADQTGASRIMEMIGADKDNPQARAMILAFVGLTKAAGREWLAKESLTREQVQLLLEQSLLTIVRTVLPTLK
ncbi:TetR/AcrR family transcriptional regulator [Pseudonocardiaceae bacterium YIM PH 21723]|nr:TetR/AcrR family transcriptional regulator [Pseudonocardiaceae bacterium YIM PH 21723]